VHLAEEVAEYLFTGRISYRFTVVNLNKYSTYSSNEEIN